MVKISGDLEKEADNLAKQFSKRVKLIVGWYELSSLRSLATVAQMNGLPRVGQQFLVLHFGKTQK